MCYVNINIGETVLTEVRMCIAIVPIDLFITLHDASKSQEEDSGGNSELSLK